jgi:hypothetical protein
MRTLKLMGEIWSVVPRDASLTSWENDSVTNSLPVDSLAKKPWAKELEMLPKEIQDNIEPGHVAPSDMKFAWSCGQNWPQEFRKHFSDKGKRVGTQFINITACDIIYIAKTDPQFAVQCTVHVHVNEASNKHKIDAESHCLFATKKSMYVPCLVD